ncbi:CN hydrolase domain-containing protein [Citrus sinensis]|uniref:CN hydrolase domain-containing protein n=1 Tax=Citrus sinensis TaxID=2711 RepID=A0ACB8L3F3_CITSI|nr:CN hydrolase domain-containing protein [Citrus sinensis]
MAGAHSVRVAVAQMTSINDLAANFATCSRLVKEAASAGAKLLCFPENFSYVGDKDADNIKIAEPLDGPIMQGYCSLARESSMWLSLGGFQEKGSDDARLCNTHVLLDDAGNIRSTYRKIHFPVGRLDPTVCYDLRFPELYQQLRFQHEAQVLLVPSAFSKVTSQVHWEILLRARAIETQCYVIAAAQAGKHNDKTESYGDSLIIDPWGTVVGRLPDGMSKPHQSPVVERSNVSRATQVFHQRRLNWRAMVHSLMTRPIKGALSSRGVLSNRPPNTLARHGALNGE